MRDGGFKADELDQLRRWGTGLQNDGREEVAAAGRAIVLLIEEIERLHVLAWDRRLYPEATDATEASGASEVPGIPEEPELPLSLARRLRQRLRPHVDPAGEQGFHS